MGSSGGGGITAAINPLGWGAAVAEFVEDGNNKKREYNQKKNAIGHENMVNDKLAADRREQMKVANKAGLSRGAARRRQRESRSGIGAQARGSILGGGPAPGADVGKTLLGE